MIDCLSQLYTCSWQSQADSRTAAARQIRDDVVLATKAHGSMGEDPNMSGNSRRWIVCEVETGPPQTDYMK